MVLRSIHNLQGSIDELTATLLTELIRVHKDMEGIQRNQLELKAMIAGQEQNRLSIICERMLLRFRHWVQEKGRDKVQKHFCMQSMMSL